MEQTQKFDIVLTTPDYTKIDAAIPRTVQSTCVGLSYLRAYLSQAGITSKVLDPYGTRKDFVQAMQDLSRYETGIYGISATFSTNKRIARIANEMKRITPRSKIIVGGWSSFGYKELLEIPEVDFVVIGPAELTLPELVLAILRNDPLSTKDIPGVASREFGCSNTRPRCIHNLDELLVPDISDTPPYQLSRSHPMTLNYYSSRGCPNHCRFCTIGQMHESYNAMTAKKVAEDIARLTDQYPDVELVALADDLFDIGRLEGILPELSRRGVKPLKFLFQSSAQNVVANDSLLADPGIKGVIHRLDVGIETFSRERLRFFAKPSSPEKNWRAVELLTANAIDSFAYLILDDETRKLKETSHFYTHPSFWPKNVWMNPLFVFPYTKLAEQNHVEFHLPWQAVFGRSMREFHKVRAELSSLCTLFLPGLEAFRGRQDPQEVARWARMKARQDDITAKANGVVKDHFERALLLADEVEEGRLKPDSEETAKEILAQGEIFQRTINELWGMSTGNLKGN